MKAFSGKGKGIGKILSPDTPANSHILTTQDSQVSQYILYQKKKSDDAENLGAIVRNSNVVAKFGDTFKQAKIIESEIIETNGQLRFRYYINYQDVNRRMDCWMDQDEVQLQESS